MRGSGSVQYGSDAIGGTIQAFSHELLVAEKPTWESTLLTRIATHGMEQSLRGDVNYRNKKLPSGPESPRGILATWSVVTLLADKLQPAIGNLIST